MLTALDEGVKGGRWNTIAGGQWPSLRRSGCFPWHMPMRLSVSPDKGDSSTGEQDAGDSPVRFGGRGK
jgi:hypothetical protein